MGCLNSNGQFKHWFANIHLSGPCNRRCYFCIGQHMMTLDSLNTLKSFPLPGLDDFLKKCRDKRVNEINITGTNTDPMLYRHPHQLIDYIRSYIADAVIGIRTNAVKKDYSVFKLYDKGSITICSFNPEIYRQMMGRGHPPDLGEIIINTKHWRSLKINIVLGPENTGSDLHKTLEILSKSGVKKVNLREPYGQPHIGNPIKREPDLFVLGNPAYYKDRMLITYWDVHYTHVESINLYANGRISYDYPITRGHSDNGVVMAQSEFSHGRHREQWISNNQAKEKTK